MPLVGAGLAGPNLADAGKQFVEVVGQPVAAFEALVVQRESLDEIFPKALGRPLSELHSRGRAHPVADGQDRVKVIKPDLAADGTSALPANL